MEKILYTEQDHFNLIILTFEIFISVWEIFETQFNIIAERSSEILYIFTMFLFFLEFPKT